MTQVFLPFLSANLVLKRDWLSDLSDFQRWQEIQPFPFTPGRWKPRLENNSRKITDPTLRPPPYFSQHICSHTLFWSFWVYKEGQNATLSPILITIDKDKHLLQPEPKAQNDGQSSKWIWGGGFPLQFRTATSRWPQQTWPLVYKHSSFPNCQLSLTLYYDSWGIWEGLDGKS